MAEQSDVQYLYMVFSVKFKFCLSLDKHPFADIFLAQQFSVCCSSSLL